MALRIPSFPCPGTKAREAEEDLPPCSGVVGMEEAQEETDDAIGTDDGDPPDLMDLIDAAETARNETGTLVSVLKNIGRRLRKSPGDRDMLCDFEGITHLCSALASPANEWRGQAMMAFCQVLPDICRTSTINRGALRDGGAVDAVVEFLRDGLAKSECAQVAVACTGLTALCTANDANKKSAATLRGEFNEDELVETQADYRTPLFKAPAQSGALDLLLEALGSFPASVQVQIHGCAALRTLLSDDDSRQASCVPSAVENRERAVSDEHFPIYRRTVERALELDATGLAALRLSEEAMLLLRELACRQNRIHELVFEAKLLPRIEVALMNGDDRVVRASLAVIRAFAFSDELKEKLAVESDVALRCVAAVQQHVANAAICEQGFGLFANLTMRKPHIAARLNNQDFRVFAVGQLVLERHIARPNVARSVLQTLRNVATQDESAGVEARESGLFDNMKDIVSKHQSDVNWRSAVEVAKQFLREFRADDGFRQAAKYNDFY
eukprot:TRINITY_DN67335_c0_g1_i1.p1 TRINITY_DN67335_c0_g1~~TRINITY_DN67335_c0_g1_i1.p1  ORF type:complete len:500 (-),score=102.03 TRINITY_DN67335_c0_g1_i1:9-1508(-)